MGYYMDGTTQVWEPDSFDAASSSGMSGLSQFGDISQQLQQNTLANNVWSAEQAEKANAFNAEQAALNREFQREMSNTSYQRAVADLKAAGLNPVLATRLAGASTPSGSAATGQKGETDTSLNGALTSLVGSFISQENARLTAQTNLAIAERNNATSRLVAEISAAAAQNSAAMHAAATRYAADQSLYGSQYVSDNSLRGTKYSSNVAAGTQRYVANTNAKASMYGSNNAYNAAIYGADTSAKTSRGNAWINAGSSTLNTILNQVGNYLVAGKYAK